METYSINNSPCLYVSLCILSLFFLSPLSLQKGTILSPLSLKSLPISHTYFLLCPLPFFWFVFATKLTHPPLSLIYSSTWQTGLPTPMGPHKGSHKVTNDQPNKPKGSITLCTLSILFKAKLGFFFFFFFTFFFLCLNVSIPQNCSLISSSLTVHTFQWYCNSYHWFQNLYPRASFQVLEPYFQFLLVHVNLDLSHISTLSHQSSSHLQTYSFSSIPLINDVISNLTSQAKNQNIILYYSFTQ